MNRRLLKIEVLLSTILILAGGCQRGDGLIKHQVTGRVLINGKPYARVLVLFNNADKAVQGNAKQPVGMTDSDGRFQLATNGVDDGAISGNYDVTFQWLTLDGSRDFLKQKYADVSKSTLHMQVQNSDVELPVMEIAAEETEIAAAQENHKASQPDPE